MSTRAYLYARSAVVSADMAHQPAAQLEACRAYAEEHGYTVVAESTDIGSGLEMQRPGLESMLALARQGALDVVVVQDHDRLTRDVAAWFALHAELDALDVRVETTTPTGAEIIPAIIEKTIAAYKTAVARHRQQPE